MPHEPEAPPEASPDAPLDDTTHLLIDLAEALHGVQAPSDVITRELGAMAERLGVTADIVVQQSFLIAEIRAAAGRNVALRMIDFDTHWQLARVHDLLGLARAVAAGRYGVAEARTRLRAIMAARVRYGYALVIAAYGVYAAAVAARVGGGVTEVLVAVPLGALAGVIHYGAAAYRRFDLQKTFIAAFAGTVAALACTYAVPALDLARALFGGISLLVPAMTIVLGVHELVRGTVEAGAPRMIYGFLRFVMLAAGMTAAFKLWALFAPVRSVPAEPLPVPAVLALLVAGGAALVCCTHARAIDAPAMVMGVLVGYGSQAVAKLVFGDVGAPFVAAFLLGAVGQLYARWLRDRIAATVTVPGLLQLAPGFLGTEAVFELLRGERGDSTGMFQVALVAVELVLGLLVANALFARRFARQPAPQ